MAFVVPSSNRCDSLLRLLSNGTLKPGDAVLSLQSNGDNHTANLLSSGKISSPTQLFDSPAEWLSHVNNPSPPSAAQDSWDVVCYNGKPLSSFLNNSLQQPTPPNPNPVPPQVTPPEPKTSLNQLELASILPPQEGGGPQEVPKPNQPVISPPPHPPPQRLEIVDLSESSPAPFLLAKQPNNAQTFVGLEPPVEKPNTPRKTKKPKKPKRAPNADKPARKRKPRSKTTSKQDTKPKKQRKTPRKPKKRKKTTFHDDDDDEEFRMSDEELSEIEIVENSDGSDYEVKYNKSSNFSIYAGASAYRKSRPKRQRKEVSYKDYRLVDQHPLTLLDCGLYTGEAGSEERNSQPYNIICTENATLFMDFHAHMATTEIIGLLAGSWDSEKKEVRVEAAFNCQTLKTGDDTFNVEMDPESEVEVRSLIKSANLSVVGWYHSHPHFAPKPSLRDVENQQNYQRHFEAVKQNTLPFIGAIVAPYDLALDGFVSHITWFRTEPDVGDALGHEIPMALKVNYESVLDEIPLQTSQQIDVLINSYSDFETKVNFRASWRDSKFDVLYKFQQSLKGRLPSSFSEEKKIKFLDNVVAKIKDVWELN